jgi:hypothetical protein
MLARADAEMTCSLGSIRNGFPFSSTNFKFVEAPSSVLDSAVVGVDVDLNRRANWAYGKEVVEEDGARGKAGRIGSLDVEARG